MENGEWIGLVVAAVVAALSFGVARWAVRHFASRHAAKDQAVAQSTQSRQVRRASERRRK
ncbi:hypothetical protein [Hydrogenophaga sp. IBVHS1]|uniref:hypothetical protein n=1 Tax=unclassified Hydrogenophaga TaxID=2610897 RepID=UPI000A2D9803|nr:hypothetical protein [Hydrogenophaga sp. IBVHS1]OSZ74839.1 hypothetical protein CAP37_05135 [Hydrogenophaga sp. IBVHS1]